MSECCAGARKGTFNAGDETVAKRTLFYRLAMLRKLAPSFVFVFDGPQRPPTKRGKQVKTQLWWTAPAHTLIRTLGHSYHQVYILYFLTHVYNHPLTSANQAPGEAEAELAAMNMAGEVDAILTSDSDAFIFGAKHVLVRYYFQPHSRCMHY